MSKKVKNKKGFLLLETLLFITMSSLIMYYFSSSIAHIYAQYKKIQLHNYAQKTLYAYTKQAQLHNTSLVHTTQSFCNCEFTITQRYIPVRDFDCITHDLQYIQTSISWSDINNTDLHTLTMNVIPWNMKVDTI